MSAPKPKRAKKKASVVGRTVASVFQESKTGFALIQFGNVAVEVRKPTQIELRRRVTESRTATSELSKAIAKPGVKVPMKKSTPTYMADPANPKLVIQTVGGKSVRGQFVGNGVFRKVGA